MRRVGVKNKLKEEKYQKENKKCSTAAILPSLRTLKPEDMVVIYGTGLSSTALPHISALHGWPMLVQALLDSALKYYLLHPREGQILNNMLRRKVDPVEISDRLFKHLSCGSSEIANTYIEECIQDVFGNLGNRLTCAGQKVYSCLWRLLQQGCLLITVNIDNIFQNFVQTNYSRRVTTIDWTDVSKIQKWSQGKVKNAVFHVHGVASRPNSIILNTEGYQKIIQNAALMATLRRVLQTRNCVFIGVGLSSSDVTFKCLLDRAYSKTHYYLVAANTVDNLSTLCSKFFDKGIRVVPYGSTYATLPKYLEKLVDAIEKNV